MLVVLNMNLYVFPVDSFWVEAQLAQYLFFWAEFLPAKQQMQPVVEE